MSHHIQEAGRIVTKKESIKIFEDNSACIASLKEGIKSDKIKNLSPRFFRNTKIQEKSKSGH